MYLDNIFHGETYNYRIGYPPVWSATLVSAGSAIDITRTYLKNQKCIYIYNMFVVMQCTCTVYENIVLSVGYAVRISYTIHQL